MKSFRVWFGLFPACVLLGGCVVVTDPNSDSIFWHPDQARLDAKQKEVDAAKAEAAAAQQKQHDLEGKLNLQKQELGGLRAELSTMLDQVKLLQAGINEANRAAGGDSLAPAAATEARLQKAMKEIDGLSPQAQDAAELARRAELLAHLRTEVQSLHLELQLLMERR